MIEQPNQDQIFIRKLSEIILKNIADESFGVKELVSVSGMSNSGLNRRLHKIINKNINHFIRETRLNKALEMLQNEDVSASEVAYKVGFSSPAYFNTCFHEYYGYPPGDVKRRFKEGVGIVSPGMDIKKQDFFAEAKEKSRLKRSHRRTINFVSTGILGILIIVYLVYSAFFSHSKSMEEDSLNNKEKSIAILPFKNLSDNKENQYFADGMMEGILNNLFRIRELRVISRTSVEQFRESTLSSPQIGEKLGINYLLEGSVERDTNEVRVFVQLIDARKDQHIYSDEFDRKWTDIFTIQSDIAKQIANELDAILSDEEIGQIKKMPTNSPEAYDSYLKARFFFNKASDVQRVDISSEGLKSSIQYYEKAIMEDSTFALAYSGLSNAWYNLCAWGWYQPYHEGIGKARELSNKALEIDPDCSEAHAVKGACYFYPDRKFKDAEKELLTSLRLNPNYAYAHQLYAQLLMITGPIEKSREHMDRVLELEPFFWVAHNLNSWICYFERKYKQGIDACITGRDLNPYSLDNDWLFIIHYAKLGEAEKSAKELKDIFSRYLKTNKYDNEITDVYKRSGIKGLFEWLIDLNINRPVGLEGMNGHPFYLAWWYAILGRKEQSIYWLEKVNKSQYIPYHYFDLITTNPDFDFLRDDPRFIKILEEYGLKPYNGVNAK